LVRDVVRLNASRSKASIHEVPQNDGSLLPIGVIEIPSFYGSLGSGGPDGEMPTSVTADVEELLEKLKDAGVKGIILDLRNNGGGLLEEAVDLTGLFITKGPVVQVKDHDGRVDPRPDINAKVAYAGPLMVLTSHYSASASEIVAGALQNYGRAIIIGDKSTHGKGTVQAVLEMRNFISSTMFAEGNTGATKLTTQKFYLPNGFSTQRKGVVPDVIIPSIDDFLAVGEADLHNALPWDTIYPLRFNGRELDDSLVDFMNRSTSLRMSALDEFRFNSDRIDWFR
jgi:carboxyl-terminal processing protease